ncbi:G-type lectin S-receptor-like serine/threonine-protein kinase At4g27290 isoform X1 [Zingiber officinale]|uniref:G-type lectin S-receptor-like serine/threonine-protein kinase At4g27290 isoform X1 n=1 Tax=Zingiber officinale TaxID=94328 RepID=UPI001C4AB3B9|nr:G-type lectin S-receptor-like serine/threonine-protein kinase At4g27290 isoform X1 [Zingiber officinale]
MQLFLSRLLKAVAVTLSFLVRSSASGDLNAMIQSSSLVNGQTLRSTGELFQLGFFNPDNSSGKGYLGIWYCNLTPQEGTVVWIANRNKSINTSMASFNLTSDGNLILFEEDRIVWSTGTRSTGLNYTRLHLLDSGNLVLNDSNSINLWQSFDHPGDSQTYLPGMKLGFNFRTNTSRRQVSWRSPEDPSPGDYTHVVLALAIPDIVILKGSAKTHRGGPWNGYGFVGDPMMASRPQARSISFTFVYNQNEIYFMANYTDSPTPLLSRSVLCANGTLQSWRLDSGGKGEWQLLWKVPEDDCDMYNHCGRNSVCTWNYYTVNCDCLDGFIKIVENGSSEAGWCERKKPLKCSSNNQFSKVPNVKVPDTENATARGNMSLDECKTWCLNDCSCVAYALISGDDGSCITWPGDLLDLRAFVVGGNDLYVRLAGEHLLDHPRKNCTGRRLLFIVISIAAALLFLCAIFIYHRRTKATIRKGNLLAATSNHKDQHEIRGAESLLFDLVAIRIATDNFSDGNKLGEGGFGPVYKGTLANGEHVAVKRLSRSSGQGLDELKNEVFLVAKLRHRNLVKLLGCCLESEEKLLVYSYLANTSLDKFLFDNSKRKQLDWTTRFKIIEGISRGLLYLHEDSPLKIIHRDLKASNILLDANMDPKISDFGLAKLFGADETQGNTKRIAGTFGYMAPEYAMHGLFSIKSDVYSYGVLVLEILMSQKNSGHRGIEYPIELVTYMVWRHWTQGSALQVIDQDLVKQCDAPQILRCIHIGLLCVQEDPTQRPTMANVVLMLNSHFVNLPIPSAPSFLSNLNTTGESNGIPRRGNSRGSNEILLKISENDVSISELEPR